MWLELYRNGQYQVSTYAHNTGNFAAASNSAVLTLATGKLDQSQFRTVNSFL